MIRLMGKRLATCCVGAWLGLLSACATDPTFAGPLRARNQLPSQLTVLQMAPRRAVRLAAGGGYAFATTALTSLFLAGTGGGNRLVLDGEVMRGTVGAQLGLGGGFDLEVETGGQHVSGGFLDALTIEWHDLFGFPDQGRRAAPRDGFEIEARQGAATVFRMEANSTGWIDTPLTLAYVIVDASTPTPDEFGWGLGVRGAVEAPTGGGDRGFGNDGLDASVGLFGELRKEWWSATWAVQHTFAASPDRAEQAGLSFRDVTSAHAGLECALTNTWTGLAQLELGTATLRDLGFPRVANEAWLLWTGARYHATSRLSFDFAVGEDLTPYIAPDFTLLLGMQYTFGGPEQ